MPFSKSITKQRSLTRELSLFLTGKISYLHYACRVNTAEGVFSLLNGGLGFGKLTLRVQFKSSNVSIGLAFITVWQLKCDALENAWEILKITRDNYDRLKIKNSFHESCSFQGCRYSPFLTHFIYYLIFFNHFGVLINQ